MSRQSLSYTIVILIKICWGKKCKIYVCIHQKESRGILLIVVTLGKGHLKRKDFLFS